LVHRSYSHDSDKCSKVATFGHPMGGGGREGGRGAGNTSGLGRGKGGGKGGVGRGCTVDVVNRKCCSLEGCHVQAHLRMGGGGGAGQYCKAHQLVFGV
jgi:hypothetical protein